MIEQEERYRTLVELAPDAITVHREGRLVFGNAATVRMLGARGVDELLGRRLLQFTASRYHDLVRRRLRDAQAGGTVDVESAPQHGTTFRVLLPAARPDRDG